MDNSEKYLVVTGANGYLGKYVLLEALQRGYHILAFKFDHLRSTIIEDPRIKYIHCDITKEIVSQEGVRQFVENKNIVGIINTAALLGSSDYDANYRVNAMGVANLLDFAREFKIDKFVQISSVVVLKKIKGPYGLTKQKGQEILQESDINYTIFIPAMILGPESLGINRVLKNVYRFPLFVPLIGSGKQTQHPIFVKDFAHAIVESVENSNSDRKIYQIAGDQVISFKGLIKLILKINGSSRVFVPVPVFVASWLGKFFQSTQKVPVFTAEHVKGILQDSNLDTRLLKQDLVFEPTPLKEVLRYTLGEIGYDWQKHLGERTEIIINPQEIQ